MIETITDLLESDWDTAIEWLEKHEHDSMLVPIQEEDEE